MIDREGKMVPNGSFHKHNENGSFHKYNEWIVPQIDKMDRSTNRQNGSFHKTK